MLDSGTPGEPEGYGLDMSSVPTQAGYGRGSGAASGFRCSVDSVWRGEGVRDSFPDLAFWGIRRADWDRNDDEV